VAKDDADGKPIYKYTVRVLKWLQQQVSMLMIQVIADTYCDATQAPHHSVAPLDCIEESAIHHAVALYHEQ
jgi:hypothetical protein